MNDQSSNKKQDLNAQLLKAHQDLSVLYEVSNAMHTTLELNHILYIILTGVTSHTGLGYNRAILFLVNKTKRCLEPQMAIGPESGEHAQKIWQYISESNQRLDDLIDKTKIAQNINKSKLLTSIKDLKLPLGSQSDSLLANSYHLGIPVHIQENEISQFADDPFLKVFKTKEIIIMPLKAKDKVNGLIVADNLYTHKPITENDLKIFTMLANQAGLAIENSQLYEMIMHKSHIDAITNLWNHGFFQSQLNIELKNAKSKKQTLSLMMIDIDNFKQLNDTHGHQNGDLVLKEIANLLKDSSRNNDYACRYGGEEFSIILTDTSQDQSVIIAERIRERIEKNQWSKLKLKFPVTLTVSIGIATFPHDSKTKEGLITKADKAMYVAKFSGKNQTQLAS